jgi:hypothetical protein
MKKIVIGLIAAALAICSGSSPASARTSSKGFAALTGKVLPGLPRYQKGKGWLPIASPEAHPIDVDGTSTPPVITNDDSTGQWVAFFDFPNSKDAAAFYLNSPRVLVGPLAAVFLLTSGEEEMLPLAAPTTADDNPVAIVADQPPAPSRWLQLQQCLNTKGHGVASYEVGQPSGGTLNAAGHCIASTIPGSEPGTPGLAGLAVVIQRGAVVVIVQAFASVPCASCTVAPDIVYGDNLPAVIQIETLASKALALMRTVGLT